MPPPAIDRAEIVKRFTHHVPVDQQVRNRHDLVRINFRDFAIDLLDLLPEGREKSLAATALEEASFWAHASVAREGK